MILNLGSEGFWAWLSHHGEVGSAAVPGTGVDGSLSLGCAVDTNVGLTRDRAGGTDFTA